MVKSIYDNGSVFDPEVLDLSENDLIVKLSARVSVVIALSLAVNYPTLAVAAHVFINNYKNVLAIALETDYTFKYAEQVKEFLKVGNENAPFSFELSESVVIFCVYSHI